MVVGVKCTVVCVKYTVLGVKCTVLGIKCSSSRRFTGVISHLTRQHKLCWRENAQVLYCTVD